MTKIKGIAIFAMIISLFACGNKESDENNKNESLVQYIDPFIGTGFHGHTFPGPVVPHGMIQLGPDTHLYGWDASSGYHYSDSTLYGFSHTHLSGTGMGDLGDFLILPFTGEIKDKPIAIFDKKNEKAEAGYYSVKFSNYNVKAELTTTTRVGLHKYSYDKGTKKRVLIDVGHTLQTDWGNSNTINELEIIDNKTIRGLKQTKGWANTHKVYFYAEFSSPFTVDNTVVDDNEVSESNKYKGKNVYSYFSFNDLKDGEALKIRVSISAVDEKGAEQNLKAELKNWDFDTVRKNASEMWNKELNKIIVKSDNEDQKTIFYTALYHSMIDPMIYQDVDGRYLGMDLKIHKNEEGITNYTVYSLWDTFRALHPLITILDEKLAGDFVNNLLLKYKQGGLLPKWPLASNYTGTMVGYPAVANIADAITKNIPGINTKLALEASITTASYRPELVEGSYSGKKACMMPFNMYVEQNKFIPADKIDKSVSWGLEMSYYDWCIAQIAKVDGDKKAETKFEERANYYKLYFDKKTGFMRGKDSNGKWSEPFNPKYSSHEHSYYTEGNAWQWTFFVPHDINGFMNLYGGKEKFAEKLDTLFTTSSEILGETASADITGLIGQYAHGNEPSHHIAYMYTYAGQPWKTQKLVNQILTEFYTSKPEGIIGNEDCGQMSAWYVLSAAGFYQVSPGNPVYTIGRPLFDEVDISLDNGKIFKVITENNSAENIYVQKAFMNGKELDSLFFNHSDIKAGSTLKLVMGKNPKK